MDYPKVYGEYDRPPSEGLVCGPGLTRASEADSCDVNKIMARYIKTGVLPINGREAFFADVTQLGDYRAVVDNINVATAAFMELPPDVRSRFENDVATFLDFCSDPKNRKEMIEMGLLEKDADPNPPPVVPPAVVPPAGATSA